jgi:hypothetical protein
MSNSIKKSVLISKYTRIYNYLNEGTFEESRLHAIADRLLKIEGQIQTIK